MATWTVSTANDTNMTAYLAYRLAQDGITVTLDQAIAEILLISGMPHDVGRDNTYSTGYTSGASTSHNSPGIKTHGNYFHIL
jgi:hypothetical protein